MLAGIDWAWETFPEYLDHVERLPKGINYGAYIGHSALRMYVMGRRALSEKANESDLKQMRDAVRQAMRAGALGLSTSRANTHMTPDGSPVASRIADWKIKIGDTIADNASYGGFTVGPWDKTLRASDLAAVRMIQSQNGAVVGEGTGAAVLGSPLISCTWLANKLAEFGVGLEPGEVVISGALMKMLPFKAGDEFVFSLEGQPPLTVTIV